MAIKFSILDQKKVIVIEATGDVDTDQVKGMRERSVELVSDTGYTDFIVDLRGLDSLDRGRIFDIYDLGDSFSDYHFTVWSNTAVLMPADETAQEQVELLHTVEINRGRGVINYVESFDEAFSWFEEMANKSRAPHNSN